jgi:hypothetical protein
MIEYTVKVTDKGVKYWLNKDNQLHCEHGAAVEKANGSKWWFLSGEELTEEEFNRRMNKPCSAKIVEQFIKVEIEGVKYKLVEV